MNNRASIERVMGFCTKAEYEEFVETVLDFEQMLARSHNPMAPWTLVRANDKRLARLNIIKDVLSRLHYADKDERLIRPDPQIVFAYDVSNFENGQLVQDLNAALPSCTLQTPYRKETHHGDL